MYGNLAAVYSLAAVVHILKDLSGLLKAEMRPLGPQGMHLQANVWHHTSATDA